MKKFLTIGLLLILVVLSACTTNAPPSREDSFCRLETGKSHARANAVYENEILCCYVEALGDTCKRYELTQERSTHKE